MKSITQTLAYYVIFKNRISFRDFWLPKAWGKYYKTRYYQYPSALVNDVAMFGGRSIGKSIDLEAAILQTALNEPGEDSLLTTFRKIHIRDRMEKVIGFFYGVPYFRKFLLGDSEKSLKHSVKRTPTYELKLRNKHTVFGISTGDDPLAIMIQGQHPKFRYMDEAQSYIRDAWVKFQSARDPKIVTDRFYGTVDGRMDTPFRDMDTKITKFANKRFHVSRRYEPWFNAETMTEVIDTFKGENSNEFKQQVDSNWGEPAWGVWNEKDIIKNFDKKEHPEHKGILLNNMTTITITPKDYQGLQPEQALWMLPKLPADDLEVILGIDGGYVEPTLILPFFKYKGLWNLRCKIELRDKIIPDDQAELVDFIADQYNAMLIPIDCTSAEGRAVLQALTNPKRPEYINKKYPERCMMVNFNSSEIIGYTDTNRTDTDKKKEDQEIKEKLKNLTTNELYKMFANGFFNIYNDEDVLVEFNRESQKKTETGNLVIQTPSNVHIPESFRCFAYGWWKKYGKVERFEQRKKDYGFTLPEYSDSGPAIFGRQLSKPKFTD